MKFSRSSVVAASKASPGSSFHDRMSSISGWREPKVFFRLCSAIGQFPPFERLIRGSTSLYARSTSRFITMMNAARKMVVPMITG